MDSPRSESSSRSDSPLQLDTDTLALLDSFLSAKADEDQRYNEILAASVHDDNEGTERPMMSVDAFRQAFGEVWQLSQFWYSTAFATRLAECLRSLCDETTTIAFLCCPTAFVAFQHTNPLEGARLLEVDRRFKALAPKHYFYYDLEDPDAIPSSLKGAVDIAVVDPPFLNEVTNQKVTQTLRHILHPKSKTILMTSTSVEPLLQKVYTQAPLGPLRKMEALQPQHYRGQLQNDFACWGSWDGAETVGGDVE